MRVQRIDVNVYRVPTDRPEADGTISWDSTTVALVEAVADSGQSGLGFSYASAAAGELIREVLAQVVVGSRVEDVGAAWGAMVKSVRNLFVCDGSVLPTQGSANPALTISALAARTADWIRQAVPRGELRARPSAVRPVGL